jgi:hypothetical protein
MSSWIPYRDRPGAGFLHSFLRAPQEILEYSLGYAEFDTSLLRRVRKGSQGRARRHSLTKDLDFSSAHLQPCGCRCFLFHSVDMRAVISRCCSVPGMCMKHVCGKCLACDEYSISVRSQMSDAVPKYKEGNCQEKSVAECNQEMR